MNHYTCSVLLGAAPMLLGFVCTPEVDLGDDLDASLRDTGTDSGRAAPPDTGSADAGPVHDGGPVVTPPDAAVGDAAAGDAAAGDAGSGRCLYEQKLHACGLLRPDEHINCQERGPFYIQRKFDCRAALDCSLLRAEICRTGSLYGHTVGGGAEWMRCEAGTEQFWCEDGSGIFWITEACNGTARCADGSDESPAICPYTCSDPVDHQPVAWDTCDGTVDCRDGSDEVGCSPEDFFTCDDGTVVGTRYRCFGRPYCPDGSDSRGCPEPVCP